MGIRNRPRLRPLCGVRSEWGLGVCHLLTRNALDRHVVPALPRLINSMDGVKTVGRTSLGLGYMDGRRLGNPMAVVASVATRWLR